MTDAPAPAAVPSTDARTGEVRHLDIAQSGRRDVDRVCRAAAQAYPILRDLDRDARADLLHGMAAGLAGDRDGLLRVADRETALGVDRLAGELDRTCAQLHLFAEVLRDGGYLEATVDHATHGPGPSRPDLRRLLVPVGPVAVFGASNFPFAFSVPGGDTVSAVAAGCPVVAKAHPAHPETAQRSADLLRGVARAAGLPADVLQLVHGHDAGPLLVEHPRIQAVGFTGSLAGGRALHDLAANRPAPIPFYGELSSLNPVVLTPAAARQRGGSIGTAFVASVIGSTGQLCTKPGLLLVPQQDAEALVGGAVAAAGEARASTMLTAQIRTAYVDAVDELRRHPAVTVRYAPAPGTDRTVSPCLATTRASDLDRHPELLHERFGPVALVATYQDAAELRMVLRSLPPGLTGAVHTGSDDDQELIRTVLGLLTERAGRVIVDGWPTGVAVGWATHHGGPYPATTGAAHTSVGATAIRRWLRPVSFQDVPERFLPIELRDTAHPRVPLRVDGRLRLPASVPAR